MAPEVIEKNCGSHYGLFNADKGIVYAPCGAIANSLFSDTFKLKFASSPMKIKVRSPRSPRELLGGTPGMLVLFLLVLPP